MSSANKPETDKPSETTILLIKQVARTYKTIVKSDGTIKVVGLN